MKATGKIHAARSDKSERLQRVLNYLRSRGRAYASTRAIINFADVCAVNSCIAELRANKHKIECKREGNVWWYRLAK